MGKMLMCGYGGKGLHVKEVKYCGLTGLIGGRFNKLGSVYLLGWGVIGPRE